MKRLARRAGTAAAWSRRPTSRRSSRLAIGALTLALGLFGFIHPAGAQEPSARAVVEVDLAAERVVDAAVTRRFIALELGDMEIPPPPGASIGSAAPLFFRVLGSDETGLSVELWELGEFWGARTLQAASSDPRLSARRVALAAAELARRLQRARTTQLRLWHQAQEAEHRRRPGDDWLPIGRRVSLVSSAVGATLGSGQLLLAGPQLGGRLGFGALRVGLSIAWLGGEAEVLNERGSARWFEVSLSPGYAFALGARSELQWSATVGSALVHLSSFAAVDRIEAQADTWSARVTTELRYQWQGGKSWALEVAPSVGAIFRPIAVTTFAGDADRIAGLWLGASLSFVLAPPAAAPATEPISIAEYERGL